MDSFLYTAPTYDDHLANSLITTNASLSLPDSHAETELGNADEIIIKHIHRYLLERGYQKTADRFKDDLPKALSGSISPHPVDDSNSAFLSDWWAIVQDLLGPFTKSEPSQPDTFHNNYGEGIDCTTTAGVTASPVHNKRRVSGKQESQHRSQLSVDELLALSHSRVQSRPQQQQYPEGQYECKHISPQLLSRTTCSEPASGISPHQIIPVNKLQEHFVHLNEPSTFENRQLKSYVLEPTKEQTPPTVRAATPPSPTPQRVVPQTTSIAKKKQPAKKKATAASGTAISKAKAAGTKVQTGSAKRKRQASTKQIQLEGSTVNTEDHKLSGELDSSDVKVPLFNQPGQTARESALPQNLKVDDYGASLLGDDAAEAALMAELARYAISCHAPSSPRHQPQGAPAPVSTSSSCPPPSWANHAAQPGPGFGAMLAPGAIAQPSLMLVPDVTLLAAQRQELQENGLNIAPNHASLSHRHAPDAQNSQARFHRVTTQMGISVPWNPTEDPSTACTHVVDRPEEHLTINPILFPNTSAHLSHEFHPHLWPPESGDDRSGRPNEDQNTKSMNGDEYHGPTYTYLSSSGDRQDCRSEERIPSFESSYRLLPTAAQFDDNAEQANDISKSSYNMLPSVQRSDNGTYLHVQDQSESNSISHNPAADLVASAIQALASTSSQQAPSSPPSLPNARPVTHAGHASTSFSRTSCSGLADVGGGEGETFLSRHASHHSFSYSVPEVSLLANPSGVGEGTPASFERNENLNIHPNGRGGGNEDQMEEGDEVDLGTSPKPSDSKHSHLQISNSLSGGSIQDGRGGGGENKSVASTNGIANDDLSLSPLEGNFGDNAPLGVPPHCVNYERGKTLTEAERYMAAKLQRGMAAQEKAREKMVELFKPKS